VSWKKLSRKKLGKKTSGVYFIEYYDNGVRRRVTTGVRDERAAKKMLREFDPARGAAIAGDAAPVEAQAKKNNRRRKGGAMTMGDLLDRCLKTVWAPGQIRSVPTARSNVRILTALIGDEPVAEMSFQRLERLKDELFAKGYKPGTVHRKMCAVSKALNYATRITDDSGRPVLAHMIPMPQIRARNSRDRVVSAAEEAAIFQAIRARASAETTRDWKRYEYLVRFLLDTGCRLGEALGITADSLEVRGDATFVTFARYATKNEKPRTLPLTEEVVASLPYLRLRSIAGKLFPIKKGTVWYMWSSIRSDVKALGFDISDVVLHTMRHTTITRMAKSGKVELSRISDWAGHSSIQVTRDHYMHLMPEDKLSTLSAIEASKTQNAIR
jgi:integrase